MLFIDVQWKDLEQLRYFLFDRLVMYLCVQLCEFVHPFLCDWTINSAYRLYKLIEYYFNFISWKWSRLITSWYYISALVFWVDESETRNLSSILLKKNLHPRVYSIFAWMSKIAPFSTLLTKKYVTLLSSFAEIDMKA